MLVSQEWDPIERCCPDGKTGKFRESPSGIVEGSVDARIRKCLGQEEDDPLRAATLSEVVVDDGDRR
jgi:hypothetical protein